MLVTPALRCWPQALLRTCDQGHALRNPELRQAMRALAREARRRGVYPEQAIVLMKQEWARLMSETAPVHGVGVDVDADGRARDPGLDRILHARAAALERIVTVLIEEYYG